jgi:hypothetical protein
LPQKSRKSAHLVPLPDWRALIVGVHSATRTVQMVIVYESGAMQVGGVTYIPSPGKTAVGEAMTRIGLVDIRRFTPEDMSEAVLYACRLEADLYGPKRNLEG